MRRQLIPALAMVLLFTVLTGLAYPLVVAGIAQGLFNDRANGQLIERDGEVVGSRLIGQPFTAPEYFHPRPSATGYAPGPGYAYGSNEGPTSERFLDGVDDRVRAYREENGMAADDPVPVDAVTGSASSLDPHISVANARIQSARVAGARGIDLGVVLDLVEQNTDERPLGFLGEPGVNVLELNLALDEL
jgi:K+-transporting ATPase ATPase C chain